MIVYYVVTCFFVFVGALGLYSVARISPVVCWYAFSSTLVLGFGIYLFWKRPDTAKEALRRKMYAEVDAEWDRGKAPLGERRPQSYDEVDRYLDKQQRHFERRSMKILKCHLKLNRQAREQGLASRLNPERLPE